MNDNVIVNFSEFFYDDGGFENVKKKFDALGDSLEKRAKELKGLLGDLDISDSLQLLKIAKEVEEVKKANMPF